MYIYFFDINTLHQLPLGCDLDQLTHLVRYCFSTYHLLVDIIWRIKASSFNGCVSKSTDCLDESIVRMDIVEFTTYEWKLWYFTLICFYLAS